VGRNQVSEQPVIWPSADKEVRDRWLSNLSPDLSGWILIRGFVFAGTIMLCTHNPPDLINRAP
jgi:hypothetical protein